MIVKAVFQNLNTWQIFKQAAWPALGPLVSSLLDFKISISVSVKWDSNPLCCRYNVKKKTGSRANNLEKLVCKIPSAWLGLKKRKSLQICRYSWQEYNCQANIAYQINSRKSAAKFSEQKIRSWQRSRKCDKDFPLTEHIICT